MFALNLEKWLSKRESQGQEGIFAKPEKKVSPKTQQTTGKLLSMIEKNVGVNDLPQSASTEQLLTGIYSLMLKNVAEEMKNDELDDDKNDSRHFLAQKRHQEIVDALTPPRPGKVKKQKNKIKKPKKEKTEKKEKSSVSKLAVLGGLGLVGLTASGAASASTGSIDSMTGSFGDVFNSLKIKFGMGDFSNITPTGGAPTTAGGSGFLGAASLSMALEVGATNKQLALSPEKLGISVPESNGTKSYGLFGMNSAGTINSFIASNPQFGLTAKPGTPEFDAQFKEAAKKQPNEFYNAQLNWYKTQYERTGQELKQLVPKFGHDPRFIAYMQDRRNHMGKLNESVVLPMAQNASSIDEALQLITDYDIKNVGSEFATHLSKYPEQAQGLINRHNRRKLGALQIATDAAQKIDASSKENSELHAKMNSPSSSVNTVNNQTIINQTSQNSRTSRKTDDTSEYEKKSNSR